MKTRTFLQIIALFLLCFGMTVFSGCSKDNEPQSRKVTIHAKQRPTHFKIFPIQSREFHIYENTVDYDEEFEVELNIGNYVIWPGDKGFQVMPHKSTHITIRLEQTTVEYK